MIAITLSTTGAKEAATRLREFLAAGGISIKQTHAYEAIARTLGYPNWNTLQALLASSAPQTTDKGPRSGKDSSPMSDGVLPMHRAIEPKFKGDQKRLAEALSRLAAEDPSFRVSYDPESGQAIVKGSSEPHLEIIVDRMRREFKGEANVGAPQVEYRETISKTYDEDYTHKRQSGGLAQYACVKIRFEPLPRGSGYVFANEIIGGTVPKEYIPGVIKGLQGALDAGPVAGFPVIDIKATLYDGAYHDVDSSVLAFEIAARGAVREALPKAGPQLLEPIMKVEVVAPEEHIADVIGDLKSRRAQISVMGSRTITAMVPLANLFGYADTLRSMSQGRARFTMAFDHYAPTPTDDGPFRPAVGMRA